MQRRTETIEITETPTVHSGGVGVAPAAHAITQEEAVRPGGAFEENEPPHVRHNLMALIVDVTFFSLSMAFLDPTAVLPLLLQRLGATGPMIGAFGAARSLAFNALQLFVAYSLHGRPRMKPFLAWIAGLTRLPFLVLPWFLWRADLSPTHRVIALGATFVILTAWAVGDGLGYVPWMEIVARAFSERTRGRFFTTTQLISGIVSILIAAFAVRAILHTPLLPWPRNYALMAAISALFLQISFLGVLLIKEPPAPARTVPPRPPLADYFRRLPALVRDNPIFRRLALIQLLLGFGSASAPFYVLYAKSRYHLNDDWGGIYQVMQAVGIVTLMPVMAFLSERRSLAATVRFVALACLLTPVSALTLGAISPWLLSITFLFMGGSLGWGMWIALNHFLLSHISEDERPIFVALLNLLFAPSAIYPFLGGLMVRNNQMVMFANVPALFLLTSLVIAVGLALALRLPAPEKEEF